MAHRMDSDGNRLNRRREAATIPVPIAAHVPTPDPLSLWPEESSRAVGILLSRFCAIDGGYLKIRRAADEDVLHLTWTWTIGKHANKYVYVRERYWELEVALHVLLRKVVEVEEGRRNPSPDKRLT